MMEQGFWFYDGRMKICVRPLNLRERFFYWIWGLPDLRVIDPFLEGMTFEQDENKTCIFVFKNTRESARLDG